MSELLVSQKVLALIVDYKSEVDARKLSLQVAKSFDEPSSKGVQIASVDLQVVHIDNGNNPPVQLSAEQESLRVMKVSTGGNLGYAGALDFVIKKIQQELGAFDYYWFLNSDLEIEKDCLPKLIEVLNTEPEVGAVGPIVREFRPSNRVWGARGVVSPFWGTTAMKNWPKGGVLPRWSYIPGCSLLIRREAYEDVGGLPLDYKLYYEETELCVQLQRANWNLWVCEKATAYHKVDSMKHGFPARHFAYYFLRNNLLFWHKNFDIPIWVQFPRTLFVALKEVFLPLRRASNASEFFDRLKCAFAGLYDGIVFAIKREAPLEKRIFK